ncbi:hypothetical protein X759_21555 [Mesorhizobium sp. LSHC420B00]|nr:hypothetical protein X759_21555 [Mesorhizobium sp. LSHC420B00]
MKTHLRLITFAAFTTLSGAAFAQTDPHHPAADAPQATTAAPAAQAMQAALPEQCTAMMSTMQKMMPMMEKMAPMMQQMMPMMQQMMQGGMMQGGQGGMMQGQGGMTQGSGMTNMPMDTANMSEASRNYMDAMKGMDAPMMQGIQAGDPDVAFVQGMIPHHQGRSTWPVRFCNSARMIRSRFGPIRSSRLSRPRSPPCRNGSSNTRSDGRMTWTNSASCPSALLWA